MQKRSSIAVIIPTYNASAGIIKTIVKIKSFVPGAHIIVVDDNSPDGTAQLVSSQFRNDKNVSLKLRRKKGGRGSAVIAGFKEGLRNKNINYFIEMDADLCHNPKYIKQLVEKCHQADVVVASRYLHSSKVTGRSFTRHMLSICVNLIAKGILRVPISDYTNGYRCYSRKAANILSAHTFISNGFITLSEAAFVCFKKGCTFDEVPINFHYTFISPSNLNYKEAKEAFRTLLKLKFYNKFNG